MLERRDFLTGLGSIAALGGAEALRPRRLVTFMPKGASLKSIIPRSLPGFDEAGTQDIVIPRTEGSLASQLYSDQLARSYERADGQVGPIMLLIAYGPAQTDLLQVHRPEVCYPAIGFEIAARRAIDIADGKGAAIPAIALTAVASDRVEDVVYWTRVGESLPRDRGEQSWDRLRQAMAGKISDGTLVRASAIRTDGQPMFGAVTQFLSALIAGMPRAGLPVLIGRSA